MAQNYFSIVTNIGRNKLALSAAGGAAVTISHFAIGDGNGAEVNPTAASLALVREVWRVPVESVAIDPQNPAAVLITAIIPTAVGGWWMREFGIFDVTGNMVAVAKPVSQYKPTALEGQLEDIRYEFQIIIGETAVVTMLVDPSVLLASREWVQNRKIPVAQLNVTPWLPIKSMTVTAPPASPVIGDLYVIPATATGAWAGQSQKLAEWNGSSWSIIAAKDGHGVGLPDGRVFERVSGVYVEFLASRDWVNNRKTPVTQLNALPWLPVKSMTLATPPAGATDGDLYLVATSPTGAWAGKAGQIAEWSSGAWVFKDTADGQGISLPDGRVFERVSGAYVEKLAQDAQSGKWNYSDATGTPNAITGVLSPAITAYSAGMEMQVKIATSNTGPVTLDLGGGAKAITTPSGSPLQSADLSAGGVYSFIYNGSNWVCLVEGQRVLDGNVTLYVRSDGNDSNDGSANTAAKAFRTIQRAINVAQRRYVSTSYTVTINCATGTYQPFELVGGASTLIEVVGDVTTPANCTITATGAMTCVRAFMNSSLRVKGFKVTGGANLLVVDDRSTISLEAIELGSCDWYQVYSSNNSTINITGNISCSGIARGMFVASANGVINCLSRIVTFKASTSFSIATCWANNGAIILTSTTFINGVNVAGSRFYCDITGVIFTAGAGANFIPGTVAGTVSTGGNYL